MYRKSQLISGKKCFRRLGDNRGTRICNSRRIFGRYKENSVKETTKQ